MDAHDRAIAHEHAWLVRLATTVEPVAVDGRRVGMVVRTAFAPAIRDHNTVVLEPAPWLSGATVADLLDAELGGRGLPHRRLHAHPDDADRWETDLAAAGYERSDTVVLRWPGGAPAVGDGPEVVTADRDLAGESVRALRSADPDTPEALLDEYVALVHAQQDAGARVHVAAGPAGPLGAVRVFPGDDAVQVEELEVLPDARGRGVALRLLARALDDASGADLVFLTADPDDWTLGWYERLGFTPLGRSSGFTRLPATPRT